MPRWGCTSITCIVLCIVHTPDVGTPLYDDLPSLGGNDRRFRKCDGSAPAFFLQEPSITPYHDLCDAGLTWVSLYRVALAKILPAKDILGWYTSSWSAYHEGYEMKSQDKQMSYSLVLRTPNTISECFFFF